MAKLPARQRAAIVIAIPAICIAITLAGWIWSRDSNLMVQQQSDASGQVILESNALLLEMLNAETGARGYIVTRNESLLAPYNQAVKQVPIELQKLDALLPDDTSMQSQRLQTINRMSQQRLDIMTEVVRLIQAQTPSDSPQILQRVLEGKVSMDQLRAAIGEFQANEWALLEQYKLDKNDVQRSTNVLLWSAVLVSVLGTGSALVLFGNLDQELRTRERLLRESRSMLQAIATHVVDGVVILDEDREIELFNPTASKLFGYEAIEVKGKRLNMLFADAILKSYEEDKKRRFVGSQQWKTMGLRKVGSPFPVEISISDLQVEDRLIVIIRDISAFEDAQAKLQSRADELVRLAAVLAQTNNMLEDRNNELEQFAYVASHDLKAPLRAIANLSEWIEEDLSGQLPPENQHQMRLLRGRVLRMEALINGLLEYSRVGRSKTPFETVSELVQADQLGMQRRQGFGRRTLPHRAAARRRPVAVHAQLAQRPRRHGLCHRLDRAGQRQHRAKAARAPVHRPARRRPDAAQRGAGRHLDQVAHRQAIGACQHGMEQRRGIGPRFRQHVQVIR